MRRHYGPKENECKYVVEEQVQLPLNMRDSDSEVVDNGGFVGQKEGVDPAMQGGIWILLRSSWFDNVRVICRWF